MALLNTRGVFFVPAFAQAVFNLVFALCLAFAADRIGYIALIIGVILGGLVQLLFNIPSALKKGLIPKPTFERDKKVKQGVVCEYRV